MKQLVWLDLCSGLGGASQPALDRGWRVIRVDIDPRFKPDIVADVRALPLKLFHVDVLWASPPCQEFSKRDFPFYPELKLIDPDVSLCEAVRVAIGEIKPRFWIVENVRGSRRWLSRIFGPTRAKVIGHYFWGCLPGLIPQTQPHKGIPKNWYHDHKSPAERAKIPYEIGEAICRAVEARNEQSVDS